MLVIVNPYATTVSDRLKNLVVYALQGRYEVDAIDTEGRDHATDLCREAAAGGLRRRRRLRRRRHGQRGRQRPGALPHPADLPAGRRDQRLLQDARRPRATSSTPPSTCCASPTTGRRAGSTSPTSTAAPSPSRRATGSTPRSCAASTPIRALKARLKQWYFAYAGGRDLHQGVRRAPAAPGGARRRRGPARRHRARAERRPLHLLRPSARSTSPRARRSTTALSAA